MGVKTVVIPFVAKQGYSLYQKYVSTNDAPPTREFPFDNSSQPYDFSTSQCVSNNASPVAAGTQNDSAEPRSSRQPWTAGQPPIGYPGTHPSPAEVPFGQAPTPGGVPPLPLRLAVVHPKYVTQVPLKLKVTEKALSFSGDDFVIGDLQTGHVWFRVNAKTLSIKARKHLLDGSGGFVAELNEKVVSLRGKMTVNDAAGRPLFHIIPQLQLLGKEMQAQVHNLATGETAMVVVKGNLIGRHCSIFLDDPKQGRVKIASLTKQFTAKSLFLDSQDYVLKVPAGVDVALCVLMAVAYDERYND